MDRYIRQKKIKPNTIKHEHFKQENTYGYDPKYERIQSKVKSKGIKHEQGTIGDKQGDVPECEPIQYEVIRLLEHRGPQTSRQYKVLWYEQATQCSNQVYDC